MNKDAGSVGLGQSRDEDKIKELEARPYQLELLEKAKVENIIVYLGTGSGKTFIAVMLIKHMRGALGVEEQGKILGGKKAIFLVSSVALVDQQAREVRNCTGLKVGSYCGADGVDDWTQDKWDNEFAKYQVLVFVHEVFKCILSSKYIRFSQLALIIMDECHHAVKSHPYSMIMSMYHMVKDEGRELMPKILGLTACVVVKSCDLDQFRQEKMKLEIKMDSKVRTTEDLLEILHYVTAPEESFVRFTTNSENEEVKSITEKTLEKVNMQYHNESQTIKDQIRSIQHRTIALRDLEKDFKMLKNEVIMDLGHLVDELGFYPLMKDIDKRLNELIKDKNKEKNVYYDHTVRSLMFETTVSFLESLQRICQTMSRKAGMTQLQKLNYFVSDKFNTLLQTIKKERSEDTETGLFLKNLSCIVFVERKSVAVAMANILADAALIDPDLSEMRVDYVHSDDNAFSTKNYRTDYEARGRERKRLQDKLYLFRKQELNVLVSTKVVEEGLDVRSCNLVIKYDFPKEFRSYVQSKGRARKRPSKYIMMAANNGYKEETNHAKFRKVEKMSLEECHYLPEDMNVFDNEEEENETYMADETRPDISGTINGSQAIARINQYIQRIPVDRFTKLAPCWETLECSGSAQDKLLCGLGLNSESGYRVRCHMPHKTPFWCPVEGPVRPSKLRAKRACALQVIRELYQLGEFTIRLKPKPRETKVADEDTDDEDEDSRGRKTGTRRKRHFYQSKLPRPLNLDPQGTGYLYKVCMVLENEVENARYAPYLPQEDPAHLGLVLAERTHNFGPLVLYGPSGPLSISVSFVKQIALTEEMLNCMKEFHQYAFTQVLKMERIEYKGSGLLLVPLTKGQIDLGVFRDRSQEPLDLDSVVSPKYKKSRVEHFFIEEWIRELNPTFKMNETNQTYLGYFSSKYGIQIQDETQPLLRISSANKKLFMFKPGGEAVKDKNSDNISQRTLLVPELMTQAMVPRGLWKQIQVIPFCLERMTSLLHASQLSYTLTGVTPHPDSCITIRDSWFNPQNVNPNLERLMRFHSGIPLKNVELLEALTLKNTDDLFDMERLEVLGDVFLKYRTSLFLYYTKISDCTKNKTNVNEGELTMLRSKVVGNKNLFRVARNLGLHTGPVNSAKIELSTWLPPGFTSTTEDRLIRLDSEFPDQISDPARRSTLSVGSMLNYINLEDLSLVDAQLINLAKKRFLDKEATGGIRTRENRLVSDKSLADVVEAIIGCFLIHTGQDNTLKVMARMGLDLIGGKDDLNAAKEDLLQSKIRQLTAVQEFEPEKDAFTNVQLRRDSPVSIYKSLGLEEIERKIGYVFNEKSFVLQAFTHSSYGDNYWTDSYERLEYLGDAVLDFLVSCYICTHSDADPGRMTDIRSALVCNNMFASLLVDKELHGNILYSASGVRKKITEYVESREEEFLDILNVNNNNNNLRIVERLQLINETEPPVLSEVEVPKVLGDVFEALMGAVFVDSGHDLRTVWRVYNNFKPCLAEIVAKPPKNPKKVLHDLFNDAKFGKVEVKENYVRISVSLTRNGKQYKFTGLGNNKKMAEVAASKCALRHLTRKGTA